MGHAEKEAILDGGHLPPPAYTDDASNPPPAYTTGEPTGPSPYKRLPLAFNVYYKKAWTTLIYRLGEHENQPLFAVTVHTDFKKKPRLVLHNGIEPKDPTLATATRDGLVKQHTNIMVPGPPGSASETITEHMKSNTSLTSATFSFSFDVGRGKDTHREAFEWRHSRGGEVRSLDKWAWGWKLVRLGGARPDASGGKRDFRGAGETSDGKEIVAVWADNSKLNLHKVAKFQFLGAGATGELGEEWSIMAAMSGLRLWDLTQQLTIAVTANAANA